MRILSSNTLYSNLVANMLTGNSEHTISVASINIRKRFKASVFIILSINGVKATPRMVNITAQTSPNAIPV